MSLKARVDKLYQGSAWEYTSIISIYKKDKLDKQTVLGKNRNKVIEIIIRF